jgi:hypothetical protein
MIHVVVMKCLIGLPLLIYAEHYGAVGVGSFNNRGVGVGGFVYRLHSPAIKGSKPSRGKKFCPEQCPDPPWDPPSILFNG